MSYSAPSAGYAPLLLSHQTSLSVTVTSAYTYYNIGSNFTAPRSGILQITIIGYATLGGGYISFNITRGSNTYQLNGIETTFSDFSTSYNNTNGTYIGNSTPYFLGHRINTTNYYVNYPLELPVLTNDKIQTIATNNADDGVVYINDITVILQ